MTSRVLAIVGCLLAGAALAGEPGGGELDLTLRHRVETSPGSGRYHQILREESWKPKATAIIVCDVWDLHHSQNAVRRAEEFAPRLDAVLKQLRDRGVTVIHAPSDCMAAYADHPARMRAAAVPKAENLPAEITTWCSILPAEEKATYPIDQSDGGTDDDPAQLARWAKHLEELGRNPNLPWKRQSGLITIDPQQDFLSDKGDEVWSILESRGIENVILAGVHTNMCVLGRPFGLRQMARNGKNVVLLRDMTDTMYNPEMWPFVSHFTGTDRIIDHIEAYVCPTVTSDQVLGGVAFRFAADDRPHLAIVIAENEYGTEKTLPKFAEEQLGKHFRVSLVFGSEEERNAIPGLHVLDEADLLLVSIRRRVLPPKDLAYFRRFAESGKPMLGIRTSSHAFSLRNEPPPMGYADWPKFDNEVWGGNYKGHLANDIPSMVHRVKAAAVHPILTGMPTKPFPQGGSLYEPRPLLDGTTPLLMGVADGFEPEPVAWTFERKNGGKSFYTSLGHRKDFANPPFVRLLRNALFWAGGIDPATAGEPAGQARVETWQPIEVRPAAAEAVTTVAAVEAAQADTPQWYRCVVRVPEAWEANEPARVVFPPALRGRTPLVFWNGEQIPGFASGRGLPTFEIAPKKVLVGDANLLVVKQTSTGGSVAELAAPEFRLGDTATLLSGKWQHRLGEDDAAENMPLPARFGAATDIVFPVGL